MTMNEMGARAKTAARALANAGPLKETALLRAAQALWERREELLAANAQDMEAGKERGMSRALLDRLALTEARVQSMARAVEEVAQAADPVGRVLSGETRPNGLRIEKVTVPLGVIGIIYEARPNVTSDAAALCLKAGNAVILRGGKEAFRSNQAVANVLRDALEEAGLPADCVQLVEDTSRQSAQELMALTDYLDVLIPRGGAGLIRSVKENARVPVIETGVGNCHVYVDRAADLDMAAEIIYNAKTSRPSVCNAIETILVHEEAGGKALPKIKARLDEKRVELRGCEKARAILPGIAPAAEEDWETEYLDYILPGGGLGAHPPVLHPPQRVHRHPGLHRGPAVFKRGGQRRGVCKRLHPVYRWRRVRPGGGNRHFHPKAPCPGPHGPGAAGQL